MAYAGGGGAGAYGNGNSTGGGTNGGPEGGGAGAGEGIFGTSAGNDATIANRGSGGGGAGGGEGQAGGNGSAGVIILRFPSQYTATVTGGVTSTSATVGSDKVMTITATSDSSQTVTFE